MELLPFQRIMANCKIFLWGSAVLTEVFRLWVLLIQRNNASRVPSLLLHDAIAWRIQLAVETLSHLFHARHTVASK